MDVSVARTLIDDAELDCVAFVDEIVPLLLDIADAAFAYRTLVEAPVEPPTLIVDAVFKRMMAALKAFEGAK